MVDPLNTAPAATRPPRTLPLYDPAGQRHVMVPSTGVGVLAAAPHLRPQHLDFRRPLSLQEVRHPDGSATQGRRRRRPPGLRRRLRRRAGQQGAGPKSPGRDSHHQPRGVGPGHQPGAGPRPAGPRPPAREPDALRKVTAAEGRLKKGEPLTPEDLDQLLQAEQTRRQMPRARRRPQGGPAGRGRRACWTR